MNEPWEEPESDLEDEPDYDEEIREQARVMFAEAASLWLQQWEMTEGSVVTSWIMTVESMRPDGERDLLYVLGSGAGKEQDGEDALPTVWHAEGMLRYVMRQIIGEETE